MDEQNVIQALELIQKGQVQVGMDLLNGEFINDPNNWSIHYHTGFAWRIIGDMEKAIFSYNRAIELAPDKYMNFYGIGIVYQLVGDFDNAINNLRQAHSLNKTSIEVLNSLGLTYKKKGDLIKALEIYDYAAQTMMGNIMEKLKQLGHNPTNPAPEDEKVAIMNMELFELVPDKLKQDPMYCTLQNNIAICYATLGNNEEARKAFLEAIEFTPEGMDYQAPIMGLKQLEDE